MVNPCDGSKTQLWLSHSAGHVASCLNINGGVANPGTPVIGHHCIPDVADEQWDSG